MKKQVLAALLLIGMVRGAAAVEVTNAGPSFSREPAIATSEASGSTDTIVGISISSQPGQATNVVIAVGSTTAAFPLLQNMIRSVMIQNQDAACDLYCSENPSVSTIPARGTTGWAVKSTDNPPVQFPIVPGTGFYCVNSSSIRPCWAAIFRRR